MALMILSAMGLTACISQLTPTNERRIAPTDRMQPPPSDVSDAQPTTTRESQVVPTQVTMPEGWHTRWLQGIPCRAPCWEGITPGYTTGQEAGEILKRSLLISTAEVKIDSSLPDYSSVIWRWTDGTPGGEIHFSSRSSDNTIRDIAPFQNKTFALGDVMKSYGEPTHVRATIIEKVNYERTPSGPSPIDTSYTLMVVYLEQGFALSVGGAITPTLSPELQMDGLVFFVPGEAGAKAVFYPPDRFFQHLVRWQGFRRFDFYCRNEWVPIKAGCP